MYKVNPNQRVAVNYTMQCICDWCQTSVEVSLTSSVFLQFDLLNLTNTDTEKLIPMGWSYSNSVHKLQCPDCTVTHA